MPRPELQRTRTLVAAVLATATILCTVLRADDDALEKSQLLAENTQALRERGISTETDGLIAFLEQLSPTVDRAAEVNRLVIELGDVNFQARENAADSLKRIGDFARPALLKAKESTDPEVAWRASALLRQLDSGTGVQENRRALLAALLLLKHRADGRAASVLLETLSICDEPPLVDAASEALWASVNRSHEKMLRESLRTEEVKTLAAALVALEISQPQEASDIIHPYLKSEDEQLQLAAARALCDRQPREAARVLAELTTSPDANIAYQAVGLLTALSGKPAGEVDWLKWCDTELASANLKKLGAARFDLSLGRLWLREDFATGLGQFEFESDGPRAVRVEKGMAMIGGPDQPECDQRLFITSQRMLGRTEFPARCTVRTRFVAEENNNFGWHLGISIGRVKVLLHPGVHGGAFRAETIDTHEYLFHNENMGFTPPPGVAHEMSVDVRREGKGAKLHVRFVHGDNKNLRFERVIDATEEQLGKFDRIALERSGRAGGAAQFDEITIGLQ